MSTNNKPDLSESTAKHLSTEWESRPGLSHFATSSLRLFFRLLYHSFAWSYDLVAATVSLGRWKRWVLEASKLIRGPRVLELGFGPGHLQTLLHGAGFHTFGLDESRQMAQQTYQRMARKNYPAHLARGMAQHLPFPNLSFDSVVATFPTLYIVEEETLAEIYRVLLPGGRLVVLMAAWLTGESLPERLMQALSSATAQVPPEEMDLVEFLAPYQEAGFQASLRFVESPGSRLMFILANKK